jgi:hypothetical protein
VAALNMSDAMPNAFDPATSGGGDDGAVSAIAIDGATVYLGGSFDTVGTQPRALLAAVSITDGSPLTFNPNASGGVAIHSLSVAADAPLYVGGSFPTFDLAYQQGFAAFSTDVSSDIIFVDGFDQP